ncbi:MAG TPA: hypothetical protein VFJ01_09850, partial [Oleiagrimonas sp.]|nr:hypothetical protein [Oleiagrimonas sp.]
MDFHARAASAATLQIQPRRMPEKYPEPLARIAQPDSFARPIGRQAQTVILDAQLQPVTDAMTG